MGYKKNSQPKDFNLKIKPNDDKLNNSVHEFAIHKKQGSAGNDINLHELSLHHSDHSKSLMKGLDDKDLNQKKKEIMDKKRYD